MARENKSLAFLFFIKLLKSSLFCGIIKKI
jgi:hypothetical protein